MSDCILNENIIIIIYHWPGSKHNNNNSSNRNHFVQLAYETLGPTKNVGLAFITDLVYTL